jgi:hypothetical protein
MFGRFTRGLGFGVPFSALSSSSLPLRMPAGLLLLLNHTSINALVKVSGKKAFQLKIPFL